MTSSQYQSYSAAGATAAIVIGVISLVIFIFAIFVWWRIFAKTGYSGALSLLLLIPIANLIVILVLAFSEWPIQRELNALRQQAAMNSPQYPQGPQYPPQGPQGPQYPSGPQYPQYR